MRQNGVKAALTVDAWQVRQLPRELRQQLLDWLNRAAPPEVAQHAFHVAIYEGCVEVTYYLRNVLGHRYTDPPGSMTPAQATWQEWNCELPPQEPFRLAASIVPRARPT